MFSLNVFLVVSLSVVADLVEGKDETRSVDELVRQKYPLFSFFLQILETKDGSRTREITSLKLRKL